MTTNYDQLIEAALTSFKKQFAASYSAGEPAIGSLLGNQTQGPFLVKLHGSSNGGAIVLSTEEYDRAYLMNPQITAFLSAVMLKYHVVFIGCSLEDEILRIRRKLFEDFGHQLPIAYALLPKNDENLARRTWLKKWVGIESILYNTFGNHRAVDRFLRLSGRTEPNIDLGGVDSIAAVSRLSVDERMKRIGQINRDLIQVVRKSGGHDISHLDLVDFKGSGSGGGPLESMTSDERVYRMLYLVSIGLIRETQDSSGR
ncbi:SIR2 family NAD-dependent protein deacylase [Acidicapsa dinghuensis]|uniref:SIR2 family NAD-dependent protein deacylase n=1 Tax=Acidicapsa dinghuensis TaxID=2218256 RepID=UPI0021DFAE4B|nr:SIR2 family protein [Acidicapsa dinghuensis]